MAGLFTDAELTAVRRPVPLVAACNKCGLHRGCRTPFMKPSGRGRAGILVVSEAPGEMEDLHGTQLPARRADQLGAALAEFDIDLRDDCWLTNALICRPKGNVVPTEKVVDYCRPNLVNTVEELQPQKIILLGGTAVRSLIPWLWKEDGSPKITTWAGWKIPVQKLNAWVCPTFHPAYVFRASESNREPVVGTVYRRQLKAATGLAGRPWREVPNYRKLVSRIADPWAAAEAVKRMRRPGVPVAFDYETDCLKPDAGGRIVCCGVSDGTATVAFPWAEPAVGAVKALLADRAVPKLGWNAAFEERWTRRVLGVPVAGWAADGMINSHIADNRPGVNSLKFQAFVRLGVPEYDGHVKSFLRADGGGYTKNRINQVPLDDLLLYCGTDALLEWQVNRILLEELGHDLAGRMGPGVGRPAGGN